MILKKSRAITEYFFIAYQFCGSGIKSGPRFPESSTLGPGSRLVIPGSENRLSPYRIQYPNFSFYLFLFYSGLRIRITKKQKKKILFLLKIFPTSAWLSGIKE
jgi:hypothetical protein